MGKLRSDFEDDLKYFRSLLAWADNAALLLAAFLVVVLMLAWCLR
jgi:hypothetical protein